MVKHAVKPRRMTQEQHEKIISLLGAGKLTCAAIAAEVGCHQATVGRIRASIALRKSNHTDLADPKTLKHTKALLTDVTIETLEDMKKPKRVKPADRWSLMRVVETGVKTYRLLSDESTANIAHRSLSSLVARRPIGAPEAKAAKFPAKPKAAAVIDAVAEPVAVQIAKAETDSAVPEPLV